MSHRHSEKYSRKGSSGTDAGRYDRRRADSSSSSGSGESRSRSRSPQRDTKNSKKSTGRRYSDDEDNYDSRRTSHTRITSKRHEKSDKEHKLVSESPLRVPPPPRITKLSIAFGKPGSVVKPGIQMKLNQASSKPEPKLSVASAFNNDSDDDVEEMPAECRMRMRNIGRDTPTSSGPNSFGKTKHGFCDSKKIFEKNMKHVPDDQS